MKDVYIANQVPPTEIYLLDREGRMSSTPLDHAETKKIIDQGYMYGRADSIFDKARHKFVEKTVLGTEDGEIFTFHSTDSRKLLVLIMAAQQAMDWPNIIIY